MVQLGFYSLTLLILCLSPNSISLAADTDSSSSCVFNTRELLASRNLAFTDAPDHELRFDILIGVNNSKDLASLKNLTYNGESVTMFVKSDVNVSASLASLGNGINDNITQTPAVVLFPCIQSPNEFVNTLSGLTLYYQSDFKARNWRPIFVLINPSPVSPAAASAASVEGNPEPGNLTIVINDTEIRKVARNFSIDTDIYVIHQVSGGNTPKPRASASSSSNWVLKEYYSIRSQVFAHEVALLKSLREIDVASLVLDKTRRRSNFERAVVIAIGADDPDYPLATKFKPGTLELESGFEVAIYKYFKDALNFTERAIISAGYIREGEDGHLLGLPLQLKYDADIGIGAAEFLEYRMKGPDGITYLHPIFYANIYAYFKQPPSSSVRNIFTQTFTTGLWIAAFGMWMFIVAILKLSVRIKSGRGGLKTTYEDEILATDGVIWAAGTICQQGWYLSPSSGPTRIIFLSGVFTGLILFVAYSAALVSILSVEVVPIQSFLDLLRENFFIMSDSHIPTSKFFVKGLEDSKQIQNLGEAVRNVEVGENLKKLITTRCAVVTISDSFYPILQLANYTEEFICKTISVQPVGGRPLKESCVVRRGSPFREWFNQKMIQMQERGIREKLIKDYVLDTSVQCLKSGFGFQDELGVRDVFTAYVILLTGMAIGGILAFVEKCYVNKAKKLLN